LNQQRSARLLRFASGGGPVRRWGGVAAVATLFLLAPAAAEAACGGVKQEQPRRDRNLGRAPLAIGASDMLLALDDLAEAGFRANARGCRQYPEALALLKDRRRRDKLPGLVLIHLGGNGTVTKAYIRKALDIVGKKRILVLSTSYTAGGAINRGVEVVREAAHDSKRIRLLDWVKHSKGHPGWFQPDHLHLTFDGAEAMARLFDDVFKWLPNPNSG